MYYRKGGGNSDLIGFERDSSTSKGKNFLELEHTVTKEIRYHGGASACPNMFQPLLDFFNIAGVDHPARHTEVDDLHTKISHVNSNLIQVAGSNQHHSGDFLLNPTRSFHISKVDPVADLQFLFQYCGNGVEQVASIPWVHPDEGWQA